MFKRQLGRSGIEVSAMGLGCWAIGGTAWIGAQAVGWGKVDDDESIRAIHRALELGVTFFDTADVYGCGHSERILCKALGGRRGDVVIASKFGRVFVEETRQITGSDASPEHIRKACDASLKRLGTDRIDLYQFHLGDWDIAEAETIRDTLEELCAAGKIRSYAWSTDDTERAGIFAEGANCTAVQHRLNIFQRNDPMIELCEEFNLASVNRTPLGMGLLTGKFTVDSKLPDDDVRSTWNFTEGRLAEGLQALDALREVLTQGGRTLAQGALGWLWAHSDATIPIPGFKTVAQIEENIGAASFGPLKADQMREIERVLEKIR
jgi:aryl-alcohol dehydrogenase-like predicted oxidoreductase